MEGRRALRLELQHLSEEETTTLLEAALGGEVEPAVSRWAFGAREGNVLYLRELVGGALAAGALEQASGRWQLRFRPRPGPVLADLISARLEGLTGPAAGRPLEQRHFERRGGPRRQANGKHGRPVFTSAGKALIAIVYLRQICSQLVLSEMLEVSRRSQIRHPHRLYRRPYPPGGRHGAARWSTGRELLPPGSELAEVVITASMPVAFLYGRPNNLASGG